jgi:hypothetical protein
MKGPYVCAYGPLRCALRGSAQHHSALSGGTKRAGRRELWAPSRVFA